jgi:aspartate/methionine/tyrosine aminotransferase
MQYRRMPIEIEAPEWIGYNNIECNLSESSFADQKLHDLGISLDNLVLYYGDHQGKPALRTLIADDASVDANNILITPGAAAALFIVATALLDRNDHLVVAKPNYATNIETPRAIGADISFLQLSFDRAYEIDINELENLIRSETKLVSLTYPHNPTGALINEATLIKIIGIVEKKGCFLLLDETYREMSFAPKLPVAASLSDRVISVCSMSKAYGLPGIRTGWIACSNPKLMEIFLAAKEQIIITNSVADEEIAYQYLRNKDKLFAPVKEKIFENFSVVKTFMEEQEFLEWIEPKGGCVCFPRIRSHIAIDMDEFYKQLLDKYKTYTGRGHWFEEDKRYLRLGFGWETTANLRKGLRNIISVIEDTRT